MSKKQVKQKSAALADQLRKAVEDSEISHYRIAKETGISQPTITRFVNGERGISLQTASLLLEYFDLEVRPKKRE